MKVQKSHLLLALLFVYFTKTVTVSASYVDALILLVLFAGFLVFEYKEKDKQYKELKTQIDEHKLQIKALEEKVSSIKFVQQVRPGSVGVR